ncbi:hypothetical protein [Streptomyces sp. NPDC001903]|uniref:hypothetical protein n=1 Tax=Streptomyces sp. NPDC001903 TaxID=3364622 RepID=UPI00367BD194
MSETTPEANSADHQTQSSAVTNARDALLAAIGQEAQLVKEKSAGQASAALVELARAYALATGPAAGTVAAARCLPHVNVGTIGHVDHGRTPL